MEDVQCFNVVGRPVFIPKHDACRGVVIQGVGLVCAFSETATRNPSWVADEAEAMFSHGMGMRSSALPMI